MSWITIDAVDTDGKACEVLLEREGAPKMGDLFEDEGRLLYRIPSKVHARVKRVEFKGWSLPTLDAVQSSSLTRAPHYDRDGVPVFTTSKEMREYAAAVNDNPAEGVQLQWDPDGNE